MDVNLYSTMTILIGEFKKPALTINSTNSLLDAREIMIKNNISRLIVEKNSNPIGIITEKGIGRIVYNKTTLPLDKITISKVMNRPLITITDNTPIEKCASIMLSKKISSFVINGKPTGIITKSDLVKIYADQFQNLKSVNQYMTKIVHTVLPSHSIHRALTIMLKKRVSRIVVIRNNKPIGIITQRDMMPLTSFIDDKNAKSETLFHIGHILLAKDIMNDPITIRNNSDLAQAARIMRDNKISGVPVINSEENLVGILTKTDIIKAIRDIKT